MSSAEKNEIPTRQLELHEYSQSDGAIVEPSVWPLPQAQQVEQAVDVGHTARVWGAGLVGLSAPVVLLLAAVSGGG